MRIFCCRVYFDSQYSVHDFSNEPIVYFGQIWLAVIDNVLYSLQTLRVVRQKRFTARNMKEVPEIIQSSE